MGKYLTTDKHPELKAGQRIQFSKWENETLITQIFEDSDIMVSDVAKDGWLKKGYIKEIQEPEHTDDDLKDFIFFCDISDDLDLDTLIKKWKESKKNKQL